MYYLYERTQGADIMSSYMYQLSKCQTLFAKIKPYNTCTHVIQIR